MFEKTKHKVDILINDRIEAPIKTSLVISVISLGIAALAIGIAFAALKAVSDADH